MDNTNIINNNNNNNNANIINFDFSNFMQVVNAIVELRMKIKSLESENKKLRARISKRKFSDGISN